MSKKEKSHVPTEPKAMHCRNCSHHFSAADDLFCSRCGQKNTDGRESMGHVWHEFLHNTLHLDGKFFKMLRHLLNPGALTVEFFNGRQKKYPHPTRFFVVIMGVFLLFLGKTVGDLKTVLVDQAESSREMSARRLASRELDSLFLDLPENLKSPESRSVVDSLKKRMLKKGHLASAEKMFAHAEIDTTSAKGAAELQVGEKGKSDAGFDLKYSPNGMRFRVRDSLGQEIREKNAAIRYVAEHLMTNVTWASNADSLDYSSVRFHRDDLERLPEKALFEKYNVEKWWQRALISRTLALSREPQKMVPAFLSTFTWFLLGSLVVMAGVLKLLYWRRRRFYVEHFVFLMHYSTMMALLMSIAMAFNFLASWPIYLVNLWGFVAFFMAQKRFYRQNNAKTFAKWAIYWAVFLAVMVAMFLASLAFSFLLF